MSQFLKPSEILKLEARRYATMSEAAIELDRLCTEAINESNFNAMEIIKQAEERASLIIQDAHNAAQEQTDLIAESLFSLEKQKKSLEEEIAILKDKITVIE